MKRLFLVVGLTLAAYSWLSSQESNFNGHVLKTNPILTSLGWINGQYENILNEKSSFLIMGDIIATDLFDEFGGVGLGVGYRRYFTYKKKPVPAGFYIQPQIRTLFATDGDDQGFGGVIGFELGYQWMWSSGFVLDLGLGPGFYFGEEFDGGTAPTGTLSIGYAW